MVISFLKTNKDKLLQVILGLQQKLVKTCFFGKTTFLAKNILSSQQFDTPMNMEIT